jgi:hypothetical protein
MNHSGDGAALLLYDINSPIVNDAGGLLLPLHALGLPSFSEDIGLLQCAVSSSAISSPREHGSRTHVFQLDDADSGIIVVALTDACALGHHEFVFPASSVGAFLRQRPTGAPRFIPWNTWGPERTHYTFEHTPAPAPATSHWHGFQLCGSRRVAPRPVLRANGELVALVFDYHPRRVAYANALAPHDAGTWSVCSGSTETPDVWENTPGSRLSFILTEARLPDDLQIYAPEEIVLCLHEDGLSVCTVRCLTLVSSSPTELHWLTQDFSSSRPRRVVVMAL